MFIREQACCNWEIMRDLAYAQNDLLQLAVSPETEVSTLH